MIVTMKLLAAERDPSETETVSSYVLSESSSAGFSKSGAVLKDTSPDESMEKLDASVPDKLKLI